MAYARTRTWVDNTGQQADAAFLNGIEDALVKLFGIVPTTNGALIWDGTQFRADALVKNAQVDPAAAIARSKLDFGSGLVNADIAAAAGIAKSKLAALAIAQSDMAAGNKTTASVMSGGPPASPTDGDIWIALAAGAAGENWMFRYNAGSASAFKWEFIGGSDVGSTGVGGTQALVNGWNIWTSSPPATLTIPRDGDYFLYVCAEVGVSTSTWGGMQVGLGPSIGTVNISTNDVYSESGALSGSFRVQQSIRAAVRGFAAGALLKPLVLCSGGTPGTVPVSNWSVAVCPIRIS